MSKIIVLMGAPGAGKGTQARLVQERRGLPQISTGDIFRVMKLAETPLGERLRAILESGTLVPDDLTIRVVEERTSQPDCLNGYVLDGFPRTTAQADMLETLAAAQGHKLVAVLIDVPFEILERRVTGRRNCPVCGEIYNVYLKPPKFDEVCDVHPEVKLNRRADDNAETIKTRLAKYEQETQPILDYYEKTGRLRRVDGTRDTAEIYADVEKIVTGNE
ncbi:MAG TPA: adenylate kinase [Pyrinomonadaceae bacterium]|nr:adenylate kinase [Pyrinomonadaceae bacterium]